MSYLASGMITGSCLHSGYNVLRFRPLGGNLMFQHPFKEVWKVQSAMIDILKVYISRHC